jgi:lipopolysaccharide export system permease protein
MIFQRALRRELAGAAGATFTVLFAISVTWSLIAVLGRAAGGKVAPDDVVALLAFAALNYLPTLVILTSFISVLVVVTRTYRDSEMVVWFASGQSLLKFVRPVLTFGLPLVLVTAFLSLVATPWARSKNDEYVERFQKREDLQKVAPGQFKESASTNRVFFVEASEGETAIVRNVFVNTAEKGGNSIVVAKEGVIQQDDKGGRFLVLKNGRRYTGTPGHADFQAMEFQRYTMRVASKVPVTGMDQAEAALSTAALLAAPNPRTRAELLWRMASPISCLILMLLAIPLGFVNPRAGSSANLIIAMLIFFTYSNLIKLFESSVKQSKLSFALGWWPLHAVALLWVVSLFAWRLNVNNRYHPLAILASFKRGGRATKGRA